MHHLSPGKYTVLQRQRLERKRKSEREKETTRTAKLKRLSKKGRKIKKEKSKEIREGKTYESGVSSATSFTNTDDNIIEFIPPPEPEAEAWPIPLKETTCVYFDLETTGFDCSDTNLLHALPKSLSDLKEDTSPGMLHMNGIFAVNCCGRIKTWMFIPVKTGSLTFVILRKTNGYKYKCVGSNAVYISALDLHTTTQYGNNIGYYDCIATTKACPLSLRLNDPVNVGDIIDIHRLSNLSNRIDAFNYSTTENRPVTINISSEPVTIPDHLNVDSFVMTISILDPDYGDYIQDFKLDYQNEYFILIHNKPPVVTGLTDVLNLDPQQLSDNSSFHIFRVEDPSDENVSCRLNKISPSTEKLILEIDGNGNGMWSNWSDYSICSVTCGEGIQTRSRMCLNPASNENGQNCSGNNVDKRNCNTLNCSRTCSHNDLYGIKNLCNGRTECAFNVTNSNVGSSCGANGTAFLEVIYNCIRNGGWSDWKNTTTSCPVNCGGALQNVTRSCTNPTPNELGSPCTGTSLNEQICNDNACPFRGTLCKDSRIVWTCQNGYIQMTRARWKASNACGEPGSFSNIDIVQEMKKICNDRQSCTFTANDFTFIQSCREKFKTCSQLEYEFICTNAKWNTWTEWSSCSKSCGTGEQVRTRNCINQLNTTDGFFIDCEGSSEESRVCNTIQCPYCNGNTVPNHMPSTRQLKKDVSTNSGMMTDVYKIECCGTINAFQFIPLNTGDVKFIVWRRMTEHTYKAIKKNTISVTAQNIGKYVQHNLTKYERIAVVHDDIVGWSVTMTSYSFLIFFRSFRISTLIYFSAIMCCTETSDIVQQGKHQSRAIDSRMCEPRIFQRSFSDTGQGPLMLSRSVQTDLTPESTCLPDSDDTHKIDMTSDTDDDKGYEKVCSDLKELKDKVQQLTSSINLSRPAQIPEIVNRLKTLAKIKDHSTNLRQTIERLETMADKTMSSDVEHIINHQEFSSICYGTALNNIDTASKVQNESSLQQNKKATTYLAIYCDLRTYFESFSSDTPVSHGDSMSNELLRVSSYSNFPRDISINLIKMAKTGFYYIDGRKTKCFSCGITYDRWKSGDDPVVIHKMLSPSCALLAEPRFSSSANQEEQTTVVPNNTDSTVDTTTVSSQGLNQSENAPSTSEPRLQISSSYNGTSNVQERPGNQIRSPSNRDRTSSATGNENSQETQTSNENHNATGTSSCQHDTEFESLGIHLEKPKYPNYACLTVRISSFEGWPSYLDQSPRQMALAGFLFAGYHDYTRCFFCGGGLRNWEAGDDPWVEHARWFPKCTFLKQNKGEKFIHAVQKRQAEIDRETNATNDNTQETTSRAQTSSSAVNTSTTRTTHNDILQTVAARSVIEMGYTDQQVINAFQHLTTSGKDMNSISATDVMYILLDDEAHPQQQGATSDVTQHEKTRTRQNLLFDDTENLIEENRQLRDQRLCKVCLDLEASIAFLPCGHIVCCIDCAPAMRKCPVCRTSQFVPPSIVIVDWSDSVLKFQDVRLAHEYRTVAKAETNIEAVLVGMLNSCNNNLIPFASLLLAIYTENLIEENRQLRDQRLCKVCLDLEASIAFLPCGHIACCIDCAPAMRKCPVCRTYVKGTVKTYLA
ncbi:unnamed protein product [Mytilus edulis]|uniref:RING-type domain-containing protein n=1 Tax=Mytilus edulis TaxID=6550 RepID=A0A8S3U9T5_MYTED|nr:unnamed protein product [Mytilus edulis]